LDRALTQDPQRADLFMEKARIYRIGKADFAKAIEAYRAAVDANKTPVTLDALGEGLYNAGDHIQAVRVLREAVEMDPNYGPALVHLGMALYARRNYEDAVTNLEKGLALIGDKAREDHFYTAGLAHINKEPRECALAEPWLRKALEKNSGSAPAIAGLDVCAKQQAGDTEQTPP
jgi:tetratricopeptide (TPR) repeat protein